ncbi:MAG: iron-siderophore ABC transporter substrate-binding protein [Pseudomonadota bacterium]|nr:iron-siderophore ABC transporter substrate-binding protein [Pseudomonadota bacterium]
MRFLSSLCFCAALLPTLLPGALSAAEITHAMGTTEVPDTPQKIVVLTNEGTEAILMLGKTPVGAASSWYGDPWYPHLGDRMAGVEVVGTELAVNLERLAMLEPDLILGSKKRHEEIYPQLSAIAPTVFVVNATDFKDNMKLYASSVGMEAEGEALVSAYEADVARLRSALGENAGDTVSVVRFVPGQLYVYRHDSFSGVVLNDIGFKRPEVQAQDGLALAVGKESIPNMEADRMFYLTYDTGNGEGTALEGETLKDPLWANLEVVKAGNAHKVDDGVWATSQGILAARAMLQDIARIYGTDVDLSSN